MKCTIKVRFILHFIRYRNNWFNKTERSPDAEDELTFDVDVLLFILSATEPLLEMLPNREII